MRKSLAACLVALAALAWAGVGCRGGGAHQPGAQPAAEADPDAVIAEVDAFTDELVRRAESAADPLAGVAEAQGLLDARGAELRARLEAARASRKFRDDAAARTRLLDSEVTNTDRVAGLRTRRFIDRWMRDPVFKTKLDRLVADYDALWPRGG